MKQYLEAPITLNPLSVDIDDPSAVQVSTTGFICLTAYRLFASEVFDADYGHPDLHLFPDHAFLLKRVLGDDPQTTINANPGTVEALAVMAVWLESKKQIIDAANAEHEDGSPFMPYLHLLTLISVFHPNILVRNAATTVTGSILHADPDEDDRLNILEDLVENCMFSSLQACAVTWLREEIISAVHTHKEKGNNEEGSDSKSSSRFASTECLDTTQYTLFPDLMYLHDSDIEVLANFWAQNKSFHLQVANFALFLFGGKDYREQVVPAGMAAAVEHRYVRPLLSAAKSLQEAGQERSGLESDAMGELEVLTDVLGRIPLQ